tara:strand:+ start:207 stop:692 length:486 start_codon:yes stop_codon:yes gene_type:complete
MIDFTIDKLSNLTARNINEAIIEARAVRLRYKGREFLIGDCPRWSTYRVDYMVDLNGDDRGYNVSLDSVKDIKEWINTIIAVEAEILATECARDEVAAYSEDREREAATAGDTVVTEKEFIQWQMPNFNFELDGAQLMKKGLAVGFIRKVGDDKYLVNPNY